MLYDPSSNKAVVTRSQGSNPVGGRQSQKRLGKSYIPPGPVGCFFFFFFFFSLSFLPVFFPLDHIPLFNALNVRLTVREPAYRVNIILYIIIPREFQEGLVEHDT